MHALMQEPRKKAQQAALPPVVQSASPPLSGESGGNYQSDSMCINICFSNYSARVVQSCKKDMVCIFFLCDLMFSGIFGGLGRVEFNQHGFIL